MDLGTAFASVQLQSETIGKQMAEAVQCHVTRSLFQTFSPEFVEVPIDQFFFPPDWIGSFYGVNVRVRHCQTNSIQARVLRAEFSGGQRIQATVQTARK